MDVIDGVAEEVRASSHPAMDALGDLPRTAWSGNEYLRRDVSARELRSGGGGGGGRDGKKEGAPVDELVRARQGPSDVR